MIAELLDELVLELERRELELRPPLWQKIREAWKEFKGYTSKADSYFRQAGIKPSLSERVTKIFNIANEEAIIRTIKHIGTPVPKEKALEQQAYIEGSCPEIASRYGVSWVQGNWYYQELKDDPRTLEIGLDCSNVPSKQDINNARQRVENLKGTFSCMPGFSPRCKDFEIELPGKKKVYSDYTVFTHVSYVGRVTATIRLNRRDYKNPHVRQVVDILADMYGYRQPLLQQK